MAKTAAERQAEYRARRLAERTGDGHERAQLSLIISAAHRALLTKAAQRFGVTQAEMLERIIETSHIVQSIEIERDGFLAGDMSTPGRTG